MGHSRLGNPPTTLSWTRFFEELFSSEREGSIPDLAAELVSGVLKEAEAGLRQAAQMPYLTEIFHQLVLVSGAGASEDWRAALESAGINSDSILSPVDLVAAVQESLDRKRVPGDAPGDVGEMASSAASQALTDVLSASLGLFDPEEQALEDTMRMISKPKGFARLTRAFLSSFLKKYVNFTASRVTASARTPVLRSSGDLSSLDKALSEHCYVSAILVEQFAADWISKARFERRTDLDDSAGFLAVALSKLARELRRQKNVEA